MPRMESCGTEHYADARVRGRGQVEVVLKRKVLGMEVTKIYSYDFHLKFHQENRGGYQGGGRSRVSILCYILIIIILIYYIIYRFS